MSVTTTGSQTTDLGFPQRPSSPCHSRATAESRPAQRQASFPTYDGSSDYAFYRAQFLALASKRPLTEWAESLVMALREPASHILSTLSAAQMADFHELDAALQTRFGRPRPRNQAVQNLKTARQQPSQSLREFGVHVDLACREAYRSDPVIGANSGVLDRLVLDNFLAGIADPATRRLIAMSRPANLTEALTVASELEDAPAEQPPVKRICHVETVNQAGPSAQLLSGGDVPSALSKVLEAVSNLPTAIRAAVAEGNVGRSSH